MVVMDMDMNMHVLVRMSLVEVWLVYTVVNTSVLMDVWLVYMLHMRLGMKSLVASHLLQSPNHSSCSLHVLLVGTSWSLVLGLMFKLLDHLLSASVLSRTTVLVNMDMNML